jgi:phospholipid-binding lipoprotein MlaA
MARAHTGAGPHRWRCGFLASVTAVVMLTGCAGAPRNDPLEPFNRKMFAFNEAVDAALLKPAATIYQGMVPSPIRTGVTNFFNNVFDAWSAVNLFLQGRVTDGVSDVMRFGSNTVLGMLGVFDVATEMGLERHGEDFGQTLGRWGVPPGPYIYYPLLGPSTLRDSIGLPVDMSLSPENYLSALGPRLTLTGMRIVNTRANLLRATGVFDDIALDKYTFLRDAYLQRRRSLVYDGNPPDEPSKDDGANEPSSKR